MSVTRRALLAGAAAAAFPSAARARQEAPRPPAAAFGVVSPSYSARMGAARPGEGIRDPLGFLRFCRERGAAGVQTAIPRLDEAALKALRSYLEETGSWIEGTIRLPDDEADLERFDRDVLAARAAGAAVLRTVMLGGRRYETFSTGAQYHRFKERSSRSVLLAVPVVTRHRMCLAVENHKDYRADELIDLVRRASSEYLGVTVDTGNNLSLLEEPLATVEALAPWAFTVHLKDMGVDECPEGFLLSEVPFGRGFLDLPRIIALLRGRRPETRFNVEMMTRDPLLIPCLTDRYWAVMEGVPARDLARTLALVKRSPEGRPLERVSRLAPEERLRVEDENVRLCLDHARARLAAA